MKTVDFAERQNLQKIETFFVLLILFKMNQTNNNLTRAKMLKNKKVSFAPPRGGTIATGQKFCSVCKNAGKSKEEYTSHFVKTEPGPKGVVICPTILKKNARCSYCKNVGHVDSICPIIIQNVRNIKKKDIQNATKYWSSKVVPSDQTNRYAIAYESDSDDGSSANLSGDDIESEFDTFPNLMAASSFEETTIARIVPISDKSYHDNDYIQEGALNKPPKKSKMAHRNWGSVTSSDESDMDDELSYDSNCYDSDGEWLGQCNP